MFSRSQVWARLLCALMFSTQSSTASQLIGQELVTFESWKLRCLSVPANRTLRGRMPTKEQLPLKDFGVVHSQARRLLEQFRRSDLSENTNWIGEQPKDAEFFDIDRSYYTRSPIPFQPFAQKVKIPPGSKVIFHGDLHGDIRSFISTLIWLNENEWHQPAEYE